MSRLFVTLVLVAGLSSGLDGGQSGSWQWVATEGPTLSPASRVLAVGDAVLVYWFDSTWRSLDGGVSWRPVSKPLQGQPRAAAADGHLYVVTQSGVIRSADVGDSFESCGSLPGGGATSSAIESLVAHEAMVYVAVRNAGMFRSRDRCGSWAPVSLPLSRIGQDDVFAGNGLLIVRATPRTLVSADQGDTWYEADASLSIPLSFAAECSGSVLAATLTGLFRSRDGGRTWSAAGLQGRRLRAVQSVRCNYFAVEEIDQGSRLLESTDAGGTWTAVNDAVGRGISGIAAGPAGTRIVVGSAGAFRSVRGGAWRAIGPIAEVTSLAAAGSTLIARTSGSTAFLFDVGRSTWQPLSTHDHSPPTVYTAPHSVGTIQSTELFARVSNGILRSADLGRTWRYVRLERFPHAVIALSDGTLLAGTEDGVFRLDAPGERWIERSSGLQEFRIAALAAGRGNTVFAASWEGRVYRSNDRGERWSPLGDFSIGGPVYGLLETKDGALFMASGGSLYRWNSTDRAWSVVLTAPVKAAEPPPRIWRIMQMSGGTVIAAGNDSLFTSEDDGRTWKTAPSPDGRVNALAEDARGRLYAATTRGVWSTTVR